MRGETEGDREAIRRVVELAFGQSAEADLVDALRKADALYASSVGVVDGEIAGHAALSPATIGGACVLALAPVAVHPDMQGLGIGTAVVNHVLETAGDSVVTVLGDPRYYSRFGFADAARFGVQDAFSETPGASQILHPNDDLEGTITYAKPFYDL